MYVKETFSVDHLEICGRFFRRGGIDINPIGSTQKKLFFENFREFNQKKLNIPLGFISMMVEDFITIKKIIYME